MLPGKEKKRGKYLVCPIIEAQWKTPQHDINRVIWQEIKASGKRMHTELKTKRQAQHIAPLGWARM